MASFFRSLFKKEPGDTGPVPPANGKAGSGHPANGQGDGAPFISPFAPQPPPHAPAETPVTSPFASLAGSVSPFAAAAQGEQMTVRELASLLPREWVRPEAAGSDQPVALPLEALRRGLLSGRPVLRLTELQAVCPQLFTRPVHPSEDMEVAMPLSRVRRLVEKSDGSAFEPGGPFAPVAPAAAAPAAWPGKSPFAAAGPPPDTFSPFTATPAAGQMKSPFTPTEPVPVPAPVGQQPAAFSPFGAAPPPASPGAEKSPFSAPAGNGFPAPFSPFSAAPASGPAKSPFFPTEPTPAPSAPPFGTPAGSVPQKSPFASAPPSASASPFATVASAMSPVAPANQAASPFAPVAAVASLAATPGVSPFSPFSTAPAAAAPPPKSPAAPAPPAATSPFQAASPVTSPVPPGASPFAGNSPFQFAPTPVVSKPAAFPPTEREPAPPRAETSFPLPAFPPAGVAHGAAKESPAAPAPAAEKLPPIAPLAPPLETAPAAEFPKSVSAPVPAPSSGADPARHSGNMELSLRAVLRDVPEEVLGFNYQLVPDSVRVSLPVARIIPQMATGRILLKVNEVRDGLLERYRPAFAKAPADLEISVPLSEVFHNLPESERPGLVPETLPQPAALSFQTPFSLKAVEDQERLRLPETPRAAPPANPGAAPAGIVLPPLLSRPATPAPVPAAAEAPSAPAPVISPDPQPTDLASGNSGLGSPPQPSRGPSPSDDTAGDELGAAFSAASLRAEPPFRTGPVPAPRSTAPTPTPAPQPVRSESPAAATPVPQAPAPAPLSVSAPAPAAVFVPPAPAAAVLPPISVPAPGHIEDLGFGYHSDISQMMLRAVYGTDRRLTQTDVVNLAGALPGLAGCVLLAGDETIASENLHGTAGEAFPATARRTLDSLTCLAETLGFGEAGNFTLRSDHGVRSFFLERGVCLAVFHEQPSFLPGVREKLILTARELGAMSAS